MISNAPGASLPSYSAYLLATTAFAAFTTAKILKTTMSSA